MKLGTKKNSLIINTLKFHILLKYYGQLYAKNSLSIFSVISRNYLICTIPNDGKSLKLMSFSIRILHVF